MSGDQVEGEIEGVEVAPGTVDRGRELAVADQRHPLLGDAAMAAQRLGQSGQVMTRRRGAQYLVPGRDDDEIAQPGGRQLEALGCLRLGEGRLDARHGLESLSPLLGLVAVD